MTDRRSDIEATLAQAGKPRHRGRWLGLIGLAIAVAAGAWWLLSDGQSGDIAYRTASVTRGDLTVTVTATGTIEPTNLVEISSELSGTLTAVNVEFNDTVIGGEILASLDTTKLEAQLAVQRASLAAAEAQLASAETTLAEARDAFERTQSLDERGVVSQTQTDTAKAALERAGAARAVAAANVDLARANAEAQEAELEKACICSPIDGVVLDVQADTGQIVAASLSAPVLFTIAEDLAQMELRVDVAEADIGLIEVGNPATFTVEAYDDRSFPAAITQVRFASEVTDGLVTYKAILAVDNPDLALRPGMTAVAEIAVAQATDVLMVPNAALRYAPPATQEDDEDTGSGGFLGMMMPSPPGEDARGEADPNTVWVMRAGDPVEVPVEPGQTDGRHTAILSGEIAEGDEVILSRSRDG